MIVTFIGTGSGITSLKRFHSSLLIDVNSQKCLVDCGDGISKALLAQQVDPNEINSIIVTHLHPDHFSGILTLLVNMSLSGRKQKLNIYVYEKFTEFFNSLIFHSNLEGIKNKFGINIIGYADNEEFASIDSLEVLPRKNSHIRNKIGSAGSEIFYSASLHFSTTDASLFYTSDIGREEDLYLFKNSKIDYLISETTHIDTDKIIKAALDLNVSHAYLTHIDDADDNKIRDTIINSRYDSMFTICYDGLKISI